MSDQADNTHNPTPAAEPLALRLSEGLGPELDDATRAELETAFAAMWVSGVPVRNKKAAAWRWFLAGAERAAEAERERWRHLLARALPMLKEHADYANSAPVWHCTGYEANTLNALIPEIDEALGPNDQGEPHSAARTGV